MPKNHTYPIEAVIFDMDGLMLDTERIARIAWKRAAADWDRTLSDEIFAAITGLTAPDANAVLQATLGPAFPVEDARAAPPALLPGLHRGARHRRQAGIAGAAGALRRWVSLTPWPVPPQKKASSTS